MLPVADENGAPGPAAVAPADATAEAAAAPEQPAAPAGASSEAAPTANGIAHPAALDAPAGDQEMAHPEAAAAPPAPPPRDLGPTDKLLVAASPLVGAWGEERYGFADARVLQVLELFACVMLVSCRVQDLACPARHGFRV